METHTVQLPGMSTDPVRVRLEVTWWPESSDFSLSRSVWSRPTRSGSWQLEGMEVSGSPVRLVSLPERWSLAADGALEMVTELYHQNVDSGPFPHL